MIYSKLNIEKLIVKMVTQMTKKVGMRRDTAKVYSINIMISIIILMTLILASGSVNQ